MNEKILTALIDGPKTRADLVALTGASDRAVRRAISELRAAGYRVVSSSENGGYWIAETQEEYSIFRRELVSRTMKIWEVIRAMDRADPDQILFKNVRGDA